MSNLVKETITIARRWSWLPSISVEITCAPDLSPQVKLGLAVKVACEQKISLDAAVLTDAVLTDAVLTRADLTDAVLTGSIMADGLKFGVYLREVVPALLTAGGKTLDEIKASGAWDCHDWTNCPMHAAFGIESTNDGPPLLRGRIQEFVRLFDAGVIPAPWADEPDAEAA